MPGKQRRTHVCVCVCVWRGGGGGEWTTPSQQRCSEEDHTQGGREMLAGVGGGFTGSSPGAQPLRKQVSGSKICTQLNPESQILAPCFQRGLCVAHWQSTVAAAVPVAVPAVPAAAARSGAAGAGTYGQAGSGTCGGGMDLGPYNLSLLADRRAAQHRRHAPRRLALPKLA